MFKNEYRLIKKESLYHVHVKYFLIPFWFSITGGNYFTFEIEADKWFNSYMEKKKKKNKRKVIKYYSTD